MGKKINENFSSRTKCCSLFYPYIGSSHSKNSDIHQTFPLMSTQKDIWQRHLYYNTPRHLHHIPLSNFMKSCTCFFSPFSLFSAPLAWNSHFKTNTSPKNTNRKCVSTKHLTMLSFQTRGDTLKVYIYFYCSFLIFNNVQLKQFYGLHSVKAIFIVRQTLL